MDLIPPFLVGGYRSFPPDGVAIGPLGRINVFAGQNNSGKSNVLRFLHEHYTRLYNALSGRRGSGSLGIEGLDLYKGKGAGPIVFGLGLDHQSPQYESLLSHKQLRRQFGNSLEDRLEELFRELADESGILWIKYRAVSSSQPLELVQPDSFRARIPEDFWRRAASAFGIRGGSIDNWVPNVLKSLTPTHQVPKTWMVPAHRQIDAGQGEENDLSGAGLVRALAELQNPDHDQQRHRERFNRIDEFVKLVLGDSEAWLEVPHTRQSLTVHQGGRSLPLANLGTGVEEVIVLAAAATVATESVVLIEEPELHLHPVLQRKLLDYLRDSTDNQYFITTHSAHVLGADGAHVHEVRHDRKRTTVRHAVGPLERREINQSLGFVASDLLQANCVLWVEGPSDRIYLNHWIGSVAPELAEGLHYQIMFYGGKLLSHLSADDPEVDSFIALRKINQHLAVVMDSDRGSATSSLRPAKQRVIQELSGGVGLAWVTEGREIENYVAKENRERIVRALHPTVKRLVGVNRYHPPLKAETRSGGVFRSVNKVEVASRVAQEPAALDVLDLRARIEELVAFVRKANRGLHATKP